MKMEIKTIIKVIAFVACFWVGKYLTQTGINGNNESVAVEKVTVTFDQMVKESGIRSQKNETLQILELHDLGIKSTMSQLNSLENIDEKRDYALSAFMGFYLVNFRTRKDYCQRLGVDISNFTNEFTKLHQSELGFYRRYVYKTEKAENKAYALLKGNVFERMIEMDMSSMSTEYGGSPTDVCNVFSDVGVELANEMLFSKVHPEMHQVIQAIR